MTEALDLESFPLVDRGPKFEDFVQGAVIRHHWGRTLTTADNMIFCASFCYFSPMYQNIDYARAHGHPSCPMNPMLVLDTVLGLSVEDLSEGGGPFLGVEDCVFENPVYDGDTLYSESRVVTKRTSDSRPEYGIVTWRTKGRNQRGEPVVEYTRTNLVMKRQAGS